LKRTAGTPTRVCAVERRPRDAPWTEPFQHNSGTCFMVKRFRITLL
jgi:hypothetical protein